MIFIGHDASRTGAPIVLLHMLRWLKTHTDLHFRIVLLAGGPLATEFASLAPTVTLTEVSIGRSRLVRWIGRAPIIGLFLKQLWHQIITPRVVEQAPSLIYANTVATAEFVRRFVPQGVALLVHVHELEHAIQIAAGRHGMAVIKSRAQRYVAASSQVRQNLIANHGIDASLIETISEFISIDEAVISQSEHYRASMRCSLGIPVDASVVGGGGATDWRKGADLFVEMARIVSSRFTKRPVHFVWVGKIRDDEFSRSLMRRIHDWGLLSVCHFVGEHPKPITLFCGFDVFVLSSREDPMPLVALEAASVSKPIVCFAEAGGIPDFVGSECGRSVSPMTGEALAESVIEILSSIELCVTLGRNAFQRVRSSHCVNVVAPQILNVIKKMSKSKEAEACVGSSGNGF